MIPRPPTSTLFPYTTLFRSISDSIINSLSQLPALKVMSLNAVLRYKGKSTDAQTVGKALNVRAVLMGRLTLQGDRKSTRLNSSHRCISYAVFCLKKKNNNDGPMFFNPVETKRTADDPRGQVAYDAKPAPVFQTDTLSAS